jgi:hypothetical protein
MNSVWPLPNGSMEIPMLAEKIDMTAYLPCLSTVVR